jgi:hypothetical protein
VAILIGDKSRFAVEIGEFWESSRDVRRVDLWAAGRWLTCDDNDAFVPQFCYEVRWTINWHQRTDDLALPFRNRSPAETHRELLDLDDGSRERYWFFRWNETTDNILGHVFRIGGDLVITFEFWRETHHDPQELGVVFTTQLPEAEFIQILTQMLAILESDTEA